MVASPTSPGTTARAPSAGLEWPPAELDEVSRWSRLQVGRLVIDRSFVSSNGLVILAILVLVNRVELATAASFYVTAAVFLPLSSIIHEAGHGIVAKALGYRINFVWLSGATCAVDWSRPDGTASPKDVMRIALAGPGTNLAVGAVAFALSRVTEVGPWVNAIVLISVLQGLLNLFPRRTGNEPHPATDGGLPTDGYVVLWARRAMALVE